MPFTLNFGVAGSLVPFGVHSPARAQKSSVSLASIYAPDPRNVIHVVLEGVRPPEGTVGAVMPAFADTLSDAQIADIAAYLRARFSRGGEWQNIEAEIARLRRSTSP